MEKLKKHVVETLAETEERYGLFCQNIYPEGFHVPVETFVFNRTGPVRASFRGCLQYPIEWVTLLDDGLVIMTVGNKDDAEKHGLPVPDVKELR